MAFKDIINKCAKSWGTTQLMVGEETERIPKLPFSSPMLNYITYGGIPRDRMTEFFGMPSGGKSTTALDICRNAVKVFQEEYIAQVTDLQTKATEGDKTASVQLIDLQDRGAKKVLYIDLEHSFDSAWARVLHIDMSQISVMQPPDVPGEEILQSILELIETGEVGLVVLDSIPSLVPRTVLDKKIGERTVSALAGLMTTFCYKVVPLLTRYSTTLILINQIRDNLENPYVVNTPGGQAIKFYCTLRMHFSQGSPVDFLGTEIPKSSDNPAGYIINARIIKQKGAPNDRKLGTYYLMAKTGIRPDYDYAQLAIKKYGIITKAAAWYGFTDPTTGEVLCDTEGKPIRVNGMAKVYDYLQLNTEYYNKLCTYIYNDINGLPQYVKTEEEEGDVLI